MRQSGQYILLCGILIGFQAVTLMFAPQAKGVAQNDWRSEVALGDSSLSDENLPQAEACYKRALAALQGQAHKTADEVTCLTKLADLLVLRNETAAAHSLYQRLLALLEKQYGKSSPKVVPTLFALGSIYEAEGDPTPAMALYKRALAINEKDYGPYSPAVASTLQRLGRAGSSAQQNERAQKHYKQSLNTLLQQPDLAASDRLQNALNPYVEQLKREDLPKYNDNLISEFKKEVLKEQKSSGEDNGTQKQHRLNPQGQGSVPANGKQPAESSVWQNQDSFQLQAAKETQVNEDPKVLLRGANLGQPHSNAALSPAYGAMDDVIFKQTHVGESEPSLQSMIAIDIKTLGPNHPAVAQDLTGLALLYISKQRYAEAQPLLVRALSIYQTVYGSDNILVVKTRAALASVFFHLDQPDKAAELYRIALSHGQVALGPNDLETAQILNNLAYLYFHQGKLQESCTFYQWALASTEGALGQRDPLVAACLKDYAQVLRSLGRGSEADVLEARAGSILADGKTTP